jgi:hypothetical protein
VEEKEKRITLEIWTRTRKGTPLSAREPLLQPLIILLPENSGATKLARTMNGEISVEIINYLNEHEIHLLETHPKIKDIETFDECEEGWFKKGKVIIKIPKSASYNESARIVADTIAGALNTKFFEKTQ